MTPLAGLVALSALTTLDSRAIVVMLPAVAASFGVSPGTAGYAVTAYATTYGILQLAYGPLSDRYGRLRVVLVAAVGFVAGNVASGLAPSLASFVVARLATGVFAAAMITTTFAYIGDTVPYERRHPVIGQFGATLAGAQVLSFSLAGLVAQVSSWRLVFDGIAVLGLAATLALAGRAGPRTASPAPAGPGYLAIAAMPAVRRVCGATLVEGVFAYGGMTYFAVIARARYGVNDLQAGLLLGCFGIGAVLGNASLKRLAPALGERWLAAAGGLTQAAGWLLLGFVPVLPLAPVAFTLPGLGYAWLHSTLQTRATELSAEARGKALALFAVSLFAGAAVGAALLGRLIDARLIGTATALCGVALAAVGFYVAGQRPTRPAGS